MEQYLEIIEQLSEQEQFTKQPTNIRIKVNSKEEAIAKLPELEPLFTGLNYIKRLHTCYHEEGKSCEVEILN